MKYAQKTSAVSPIVATLVLIVVAVVGAVAVGTILGTFSSDVSKQTDTGAVAGASQTEILTGGSTTVQPASEQLAKVYMAQHPGIKITVTGGSSDAGVAQTGSGVLDIGASSDLSKITTAQSAHADWDLRGYQIGASGVVFIASNEVGATLVENLTDATATTGGLAGMYKFGGDSVNLTGIAEVWQRSDGSGTEETAAKALGLGSNLDAYAAVGNAKAAIGNAGVYAAIRDSTKKSVGFVDMGYVFDSSGNVIDPTKITVISIADPSGKMTTSRANILTAAKVKLADPVSGTSTAYPVSLARGLYYMTKGEPNSVVKNFITFAEAPTSCDAMHAAGVFCNADVA